MNDAHLTSPTAEKVIFPSDGLGLCGFLRPASGFARRAVVFCHGPFSSQDQWFDYAERLQAEGITSFTFDFTGHGLSQGLRNLVDLQVWAYNIRDALTALQSQNYTQFALVGTGSGASAALLAAAHDARLACVTTIGAAMIIYPPIGERLAYGLAGLAAGVKRAIWKKELTLSRLNELSEMSFLSDEQANQEYLSDPRLQENYRAIPLPESLHSVWVDISRAIDKIDKPVLLMHGQKDQIIPSKQSQQIYDRLQAEKKLHFFPESGHLVHLDVERDAAYELMVKWIKRHLKD